LFRALFTLVLALERTFSESIGVTHWTADSGADTMLSGSPLEPFRALCFSRRPTSVLFVNSSGRGKKTPQDSQSFFTTIRLTAPGRLLSPGASTGSTFFAFAKEMRREQLTGFFSLWRGGAPNRLSPVVKSRQQRKRFSSSSLCEES